MPPIRPAPCHKVWVILAQTLWQSASSSKNHFFFTTTDHLVPTRRKFKSVRTWRMTKYKGERHAYLFTKRGIKRANYCGPGTQLKKRLKNGDKPVSNMDAICQKHDIAYAKAKNQTDIRNADLIMLNRMDTDASISATEKTVIGGLMRGKIAGEKLGIFGPEFFTEIPGLHENNSGAARKKRENLRLYLDDNG